MDIRLEGCNLPRLSRLVTHFLVLAMVRKQPSVESRPSMQFAGEIALCLKIVVGAN